MLQFFSFHSLETVILRAAKGHEAIISRADCLNCLAFVNPSMMFTFFMDLEPHTFHL